MRETCAGAVDCDRGPRDTISLEQAARSSFKVLFPLVRRCDIHAAQQEPLREERVATAECPMFGNEGPTVQTAGA